MASAPPTQEMLMEAFQTALRTPQTVVVLPETDPEVVSLRKRQSDAAEAEARVQHSIMDCYANNPGCVAVCIVEYGNGRYSKPTCIL